MHIYRPLAAFAIAMILLGLPGCESSTAPDDGIAGTFQLTAFDGARLPIVFFEDADLRAEIVGGSLTMGSDGRYEEPIVYRFVDKHTGQADTDTGTDVGTYRLTGSTITFQSDDPEVGSYSGSISGDVIRYTIGSVELTFTRGN